MNIIGRLSEPSTHAGIALLFQAGAVMFPQYQLIFMGLSALFGGGAVVLPEKK